MSDFKVGDKVLIKPDSEPAIIREIIPKINGEMIYKIWWDTEIGKEPSILLFSESDLETIEPEYPLSFQEALKAAIDGKVVEDEYGILVRFDIDKCRFIVDSGSEKTEMKGEGLFKGKSEYKYRIYEAKPKFKRGDFVVWDDMYYRILNVHQSISRFSYDLVYNQDNFNISKSQHEDIDESDLTLVGIIEQCQ